MADPAGPTTDQSVALRLALLLGQGFFVGFGLVLWYVAANTLFLVDWGAARMPWVFVGVALLVSAFSYGLAELQRRWTTARVVLTIGLVLVGCNVLARLALFTPLARGVSFVLMVSYFLGLQMAFITLGLLAGRLFDIRQMKRFFPTVLSGFLVGFIAGGLTVPLLLPWIGGGAANLLGVAAISTLISLAFLLVSAARFRGALARSPVASGAPPASPLRRLLRQRYVARTLAYQVAAVVGPVLTLFVLLRVAESQFPTADALAGFFGAFGAVRNIAGVLFALLAAGWLLSRHGLGFGLTAHPVAAGVLGAGLAAAAMGAGPGSATFFWVAVICVGMDVVLSDGLTSPSLKTVYQALPAHGRQQVETVVEGIGVPVGYGAAGVALLLFTALGLTILELVLVMVAAIVPRVLLGLLLYHNYAGELLRGLSRRTLGDAVLSLDDGSSLAVVERLLQSPSPGDVRLALDLLERTEHPTLGPRLIDLLAHPDANLRREALDRLARRPAPAALAAVKRCLRPDEPPSVRGAALATLCALLEIDAIERVGPYLDAPEPDVRMGAIVGLLRHGGIAGILAAGQQLTALTRDPEPAARRLAAQVIGAVGLNHFYQPLLPLLQDAEPSVRRHALAAARHVAHPRLLPNLIDNLKFGATRGRAADALTASGELIVPVVEEALSDGCGHTDDTLRRLVRACAQIRGARVMALLGAHRGHPSPAVQEQVLYALHRCGYRTTADDPATHIQALLVPVRQAWQVVLARRDLGEHPALALLHAALALEFGRARQRVFLTLSFRHNARALLAAEARLARGTRGEQALVLETLDVILTTDEQRLVLPLVDEAMGWVQRRAALDRYFNLPTLSRDERLVQIMTDAATWTSPWTRGCAVHAAHRLASGHALAVAASAGREETRMLPLIERVALLKAVTLFAETPDDVLAAVASICEDVETAPGETLIREGDLGDCMYVIVEGEVRVHAGERTILTLGPGQSVGELAVLDPEPRAASVTALQLTRLFRIHREAFDEIMADRPEIASGVIRALCQRLRQTSAARPA